MDVAELVPASTVLLRTGARIVTAMQDLGAPVAYAALSDGTPVYDRAGRNVGVVEHVLAEPDLDIFHGLIIHTKPLPGRHLYADADQVAELHEGGVVLAVEEGDLHEPSAPSTRPSAGARQETPLEARVRRAWDWISSHV